MARSNDPIVVPVRYPTASIFIDESGSRATMGSAFVIAAIKLREPGRLSRSVRDLRDRYGFDHEFKFSEINRSSSHVYVELLRLLHASDATIAATIVQSSVYNPFSGGKDQWRVHAEVTAQLLRGCINKRELVGVHLDAITTPAGCSMEDTVRNLVNSRLRSTSVVSAVCLDSRTNDLLQVVDVVAGSIRYERRVATSGPAGASASKATVARELGGLFGRPGLADGKDARVNLRVFRGPRAEQVRRTKLTVVTSTHVAG